MLIHEIYEYFDNRIALLNIFAAKIASLISRPKKYKEARGSLFPKRMVGMDALDMAFCLIRIIEIGRYRKHADHHPPPQRGSDIRDALFFEVSYSGKLTCILSRV